MSDNFKEEFEKNLILENIKEELEQKDHRIKVLERAFHLALASYGIRIGQYDMTAYGNDLLSQAEKEIKDEI